jgi:von Willebrand factor A domain-containing protein 8
LFSDTAGLGGRGGPFRLDRGHKIHQVSDEAKAQVSKEAAEAARRIAEQGLKDRLNEIGMSSTEWEMYDTLVDPIRDDINNLRGLLKSVKSMSMERTWIKRQRYGELDDSKIVVRKMNRLMHMDFNYLSFDT